MPGFIGAYNFIKAVATMPANGVVNGDAPAAKKQKTERTLHDEHNVVLVLDYGSQYTQLICRRIREIGVFSMMFPGDASMVGFCCFRHCSLDMITPWQGVMIAQCLLSSQTSSKPHL